MSRITLKNDGYGAFNGLITALGKTGTGNAFFGFAEGAASQGIVIYDLYVNYSGSAGIYLTLYDAPAAVGGTGGPVINTGAIAQFYVKNPGFVISGWPGRFFFKGVVFVASADITQSTAPDFTPSISFGYA